MRLSTLTASTATLLLSSTALLAQEAQQSATTGFQNVYVDVDGSAVQVPVDLAAQACALDAATLQQVAQTPAWGSRHGRRIHPGPDERRRGLGCGH
jgi:hypothetical protein